MKTRKPAFPRRQRGISLVVTLLLVVLLSLLGLYGAGILVLDTRSAANDVRAREAAAAAESGTEQGLSFVNANRDRLLAGGFDSDGDGAANVAWTTCGASDAMCQPIRAADRTNWKYLDVTAYASQPGAGSLNVFVLTPVSGDESLLVYNVVSTGTSGDGTGQATLKQGAYLYPLLLGNVGSPLAAATNVSLSGNYSIITNSNGGGSGVPVSAWSNGTLTPGGSFTSCHVGDFSSGACPSDDALSKSGLTGADLVGNDPNFPTDLFEFLFGVPEAEYQKIKDEAQVVANCNGLSAASSGLIWVTGACNPPGDVGSADEPVLMVVEGDTTLNAGSQFYGLLYMFNPAGGAVPRLIANGNAHLHGAVFAHDGVNLQLNGGFVLEYDSEVLENLKNDPSARGLARIPGAWSDVQ